MTVESVLLHNKSPLLKLDLKRFVQAGHVVQVHTGYRFKLSSPIQQPGLAVAGDTVLFKEHFTS